MKRVACLLVTCLAWAGDGGSALAKDKPFTVWTETDPFAPELIVVSSSAITIKDVQFFQPWFSLFQAKYLYNKEAGTGIYVFDISYFGDNWIFWDALTVKLGPSEVRRLETLGTPRRDTRVGGVEEHVRFAVPTETMIRIAGMSQVDMRVNGKYYYDFYLTSIGTAGMRMLLAKAAEIAPNAPETRATPVPSSVVQGEPATAPRYIEELRELAKLRDQGVLTEVEFTAKKRQLLGVDDAGQRPASPEPAQQGQPSPPPPSSKLVASIEATFSTQTDSATTIAWVLHITSTGPRLADADIQFLDASGLVVTSRQERDLQLVAGAPSTFRGTTELPAEQAAKVVRLGVKVTAR